MARTPEKPKLPARSSGGRPSLYTEELADEIIERVSSGETLINVVRVDENGIPRVPKTFPAYHTIRDWADPADTRYREDFGIRFAKARLHQMHLWVEEIIDIADAPQMGIEELYLEDRRLGTSTLRRRGPGEDGPENEIVFISKRKMKKDMINHRQLRIETRLRAVARLNPAMWMERLQVTQHNVNAEENQIVVRGGLPDGPPASAATIEGDFTEKPPE